MKYKDEIDTPCYTIIDDFGYSIDIYFLHNQTWIISREHDEGECIFWDVSSEQPKNL